MFHQMHEYAVARWSTQSYIPGYNIETSTDETAVVSVFDDIFCEVDSGKVCALVLLDLNTAFDTVDHSILLTVFKDRFGV